VIILFSVKIVHAQTNPKANPHDSVRVDKSIHPKTHRPTDPKLNPHDSVRVNKVSINPRNDSVADVAINYTDASGKPNTLHLTANFSKNDSHETNIVYDEESGERREVSIAETKEIVKQIILNPPTEDIYFVDGREYSPGDIKKLNPQDIKTINVYSKQEAVKRYGDKAKNGAIVFTTK
jgi:hypothetical protein